MDYHRTMREAARAAGGRLAGDYGADVEHSIKDVDSLERKVGQSSDKGASTEDSLLQINDMNRYTILFDEADYTAGTQRAREHLEERGFSFAYGRNTWDDPFYKGYNTGFLDQSRPHAALDPDLADVSAPRHPVEVQFHTRESFDAKSDNHDLYKLVRSGELSRHEVHAAMELQARRNESVASPPDQERLEERMPARERRPDTSPELMAKVRQRQADLQTGDGQGPEPEATDSARAASVPRQRDSGAGSPEPAQPPAEDLRQVEVRDQATEHDDGMSGGGWAPDRGGGLDRQ